jgi:hypothetical protein
MTIDTDVTKAIVTVISGRGFVVEAGHERLVITAAHCLPHLPPCHGAANLDERTYDNLLGPFGDLKPKVSAECRFADPVADIAVLGSPDGQELGNEAEAYEALTEEAAPLQIGEAADQADAWLVQLDGRVTSCRVSHCGGPLWIEDAKDGIHGGMSGSPILTDDAVAIGVVCLSWAAHSGGPNPRLTHHLPGWLLQALLSLGSRSPRKRKVSRVSKP